VAPQETSEPYRRGLIEFPWLNWHHNVVATIIKLEPRHPWRQLEQQRSERAIRLPQQERPRQPEQQPGLPLHEFRQQPSLRTDLDLSD
jgi:hypothetical protein